MDMSWKCCLCESSLDSRDASARIVIKGKSDKSLTVCSNCQGDLYLDGIRFTRDIMIVPVREDSLNIALTQRLYVCPDKYVKRNPKLIAFYVGGGVRARGGRVGAITHIGCVKCIEENVPKENIVIISNQIGAPRWKTFEKYKVFHLRSLIELERHIRRGKTKGAAVQNRIYATFHRFLNAQTVQDLYEKKYPKHNEIKK